MTTTVTGLPLPLTTGGPGRDGIPEVVNNVQWIQGERHRETGDRQRDRGDIGGEGRHREIGETNI